MDDRDPEASAYVADLRSRGVSDARITAELLKAGWSLSAIGTLLGPAPGPAPAPRSSYSLSPAADASPEHLTGDPGLAYKAMVLGIIALMLPVLFPLVGYPLGLLGLLLAYPLGLVALILGVVSLALRRPGSGMAVAGLVLALLGPLLAWHTSNAIARSMSQSPQYNNCLSNVKQIQLGLIMYASDNNQMYPPAAADNGASLYWPTPVLPYIKNVQIFLCPSDQVVTGSIVLPPPNDPTNISYGRNSFMGTPGFSDATCKYPEEMLGVIDAVAPTVAYDGMFPAVQAQIAKDGLVTNTRHNNGCNQSYMDGHVKWIMFANIPDPAGGSPPPKSPAKHYWQGTD